MIESVRKSTGVRDIGAALKRRLSGLRKKGRSGIGNTLATYPGEREILRTATLVVTDTRLAYIDQFDRTLKTYMFEHMISIDKKYYSPNPLNRRLCKALVGAAVFFLLVTAIADLTNIGDTSLLIVYVPLILSLTLGLLVWRDMRPRYQLEWQMINGHTDKIVQEPMGREWLSGSTKREAGMNKLANAMVEAMSAKSWWPSADGRTRDTDDDALATSQKQADNSEQDLPAKQRKLELVTSLYAE